jgi:hypothetical protein
MQRIRYAGIIATVVLAAGSSVWPDNINPGNNGSRMAYSENAGWINAQPLGPGGPGMQVGDLAVTGWLWSENAGWISLSCTNDSSCGTVTYGVTNDLSGRLGGFGWGENVGWVSFNPDGQPVTIDRPTGMLTGRAWAENIGWIMFSAISPVAYQVVTSWCLPAPDLPTIPDLTVQPSPSGHEVSLGPVAPNVYYDLVRGDVVTLRSSGGSFAAATEACVATHATGALAINEPLPPGGVHWYLARSANCSGHSTYNELSGDQAAPRDAGIAASGSGCP